MYPGPNPVPAQPEAEAEAEASSQRWRPVFLQQSPDGAQTLALKTTEASSGRSHAPAASPRRPENAVESSAARHQLGHVNLWYPTSTSSEEQKAESKEEHWHGKGVRIVINPSGSVCYVTYGTELLFRAHVFWSALELNSFLFSSRFWFCINK